LAGVEHANDPHLRTFNRESNDHAAAIVREVKTWAYVVTADRARGQLSKALTMVDDRIGKPLCDRRRRIDFNIAIQRD
jgi:hypothetical protein